MKKFFISAGVLFLAMFAINAQNSILKPNQLIQDAKKSMSIVPVNLFSIADTRNSVSIPSEIQDYSLLQLDKKVLKKLNEEKAPLIALTIPQAGRNDISLELVEVNPFAEGFTVKTAPSMQPIKVNTGKHYRGIIKGQERSIAAISIFGDQVIGMVSHPSATGNLVIGKLEGAESHILYQDDQIAPLFDFDCKAKDGEFDYSKDQIRGVDVGTRALSDCVRLYLEVDYDIFQNKGGSAGVTTFVTGIFNQVSALYSAEQINTVISEIVIWTQASPYNSTSSSGMLNAFTAYRQGFNGDLAQLLSYKASGGIAYVNGICSSNPDYSMSYSGIQSTYQNVPTYSWTVEVCTHEFGHLFGSQHTHACVWNGNNTAIDGCYTTEGGCPNPGLPSSGGGTIMSYCHLTNAGINFSNGFGTQPGNVIRSRVTNGSCLQACSGGGGGGGGGGSSCSDNELVLELRTDNYPTETTWNIKNSAGATLYSGGPYSTTNTLNIINLCLPTGCFTFNINDSYGDGICCAYGSGYYNIKQGSTLLATGGQFTFTQTVTFCASGTSTSTCTDGVQNGQETGIDCGGPTCPACPTCTDGIKNGQETGVDCGGPTCPSCPTCTDGIKNGQETGIDCGGPTCPACPTCTDGIQNGGETGLDCGGPNCAPCNTSTCTDGIQNGQETGVDCGGPTCPPCNTSTCTDGVQNGQETGIDCGGPTCPSCPTCTDGIQNGGETGVDCGGPNCPACPTNGTVQVTTLSGHYFESGMDGWVDGGSDCSRVNTSFSPEGSYSIQLRDNSGVASSMTSDIYNLTQFDSVTVEFQFRAVGFETGEDFWLRYFNGSVWVTVGSYSLPANFNNNVLYSGKVKINSPLSSIARFNFQADASDNSDQVYIDAVIIKGYKTTGTPSATCTDGIQNGQETGIDCGGPTCPACPTCFDGIQNGSETGVDCGGPSCPSCPTCFDGIQNGNETGIDCGGSCSACPTCFDGIQNGGETGVDCGGPNCAPCNTATCNDGIQNGQETGIDCGGPTCAACPTCTDGIQNGTETGIDCGGSCTACPTCTDGVQNGNETGVDCGGSCTPCNTGGSTLIAGHYFETGMDGWIDGGSDCYRYYGTLSPEGNYSIRLRDNSGNQSAMTSPTFNLASYNSANVEFRFRSEGMETGEDFWLLYYNGSSWINIGTFVAGVNFANNQLYTVNVTLTGGLSNVSRFKFQCDASENDDIVYVDAFVLTGSTGSSSFESPIVIKPLSGENAIVYSDAQGIQIYPNPAENILTINTEEEVLGVQVYNISGQLMQIGKDDNHHQLDISNLQSGMYIISVETEENVYSEKIIKK